MHTVSVRFDDVRALNRAWAAAAGDALYPAALARAIDMGLTLADAHRCAADACDAAEGEGTRCQRPNRDDLDWRGNGFTLRAFDRITHFELVVSDGALSRVRAAAERAESAAAKPASRT